MCKIVESTLINSPIKVVGIRCDVGLGGAENVSHDSKVQPLGEAGSGGSDRD